MKMIDFFLKIGDLVEKHYPHLRHSLRGQIEIDDFMKKEIIKLLD